MEKPLKYFFKDKQGGEITMVQVKTKFVTVDEFITNYGDNERYELIDGELFEMEPQRYLQHLFHPISRTK